MNDPDINSNLIEQCEEYQNLLKESETLKMSLYGHLSKSERDEKSSRLVKVKLKMSQVIGEINDNGHNHYLPH